MSTQFAIPGYDNVIDMKRFRTFRDIKRLFNGYKIRLLNMPKDQIEVERLRLKEEAKNYPTHTLTAVKVQIFENATQTKLGE